MSATRSLAPGVKSHTHRAGPDPARVDIAARHCTPQLHADPPGRGPRQAAPARTGTNSMPYGRPDADPSRPYCGAALTTREELNSKENRHGCKAHQCKEESTPEASQEAPRQAERGAGAGSSQRCAQAVNNSPLPSFLAKW